MSRYFYYSRDDEWVRVLADSYTQSEPPPSPGNCSVAYDWSLNCTAIAYPFSGEPAFTYESQQYIRIVGPLTQYSFLLPGVVSGGMGSFQAPSLEIKLGGVVVDAFFPSDPSGTRKNRANNQLIGPISNQTITRVDAQPDNCSVGGGGCQTRFFVDGLQILGLDSCPEIRDSADDGQCSDCCSQLLSIARSISI
jgi:hypothetical protein